MLATAASAVTVVVVTPVRPGHQLAALRPRLHQQIASKVAAAAHVHQQTASTVLAAALRSCMHQQAASTVVVVARCSRMHQQTASTVALAALRASASADQQVESVE